MHTAQFFGPSGLNVDSIFDIFCIANFARNCLAGLFNRPLKILFNQVMSY